MDGQPPWQPFDRSAKRCWALALLIVVWVGLAQPARAAAWPGPVLSKPAGCQARQHLGLPLAAVISPWARPELVLGLAGNVELGRMFAAGKVAWRKP